jgi:hypothetical protein
MKKYKRITCPECGRDLPIIKGRICTHGPGKSSLFCSGSGQEVHLTKRAPDGATGCAICGSTDPNVHFTEVHRSTGTPRR